MKYDIDYITCSEFDDLLLLLKDLLLHLQHLRMNTIDVGFQAYIYIFRVATIMPSN